MRYLERLKLMSIDIIATHPRAFSSEVGTGSREENASKRKARARF
jgi:hypothetical protein